MDSRYRSRTRMPQMIKQLPDHPRLELLGTEAEQLMKQKETCTLSGAEQLVADSY